MKPLHKTSAYYPIHSDFIKNAAISYADTSAFGLNNLQPVQVYYASMSYDFFFQERGKRHYELTNHLGNVLTVISDKRILVCNADTVTYSYASIISATDYSPFGAPLAGRTFSSESYRYRFNGKENDSETHGDGNSLDFGARIYDVRLGRFFSIDLLSSCFPNESHFSFAGNNPNYYIDFNGLYKIHPSDLKTWKENYPLLLIYIQNEFGKDLSRDKELFKNLALECKITESQLNTILSISGPFIMLGNIIGTANTSSQNSVTLNKDYLTNIEMVLKNPNSTYIEKQAAILTFYITMVHETVHIGYYLKNGEHDGTDGVTVDEVGDRFIQKNFGFNPSNAISIMNLPMPIDNTRTYENERISIEQNNSLCNLAARCSITQGQIEKNKIETNKVGDRTLIKGEKEGSGIGYINRSLPTTPTEK